MERHEDRVTSLMFSPDDGYLASISMDSIHIWDTGTTAHVSSLPTSPRERCDHIAFSPDSKEIAGFAHFNEELCIWRLNGEERTVANFQGTVEGLVFSPTGKLLVSMHRNPDHCIVLWNVDNKIVPIATLVVGMELSQLPTLREYRPGISSDGVYLTLGSSIWNITYTPPRLLGRNQRPNSLFEKVNPHQSLLCYIEGWIYSAYPPGRLLPVPDQLRERFKNWGAVGNKIVAWTASGSPIVIDCSPLLKRFL
jgi:WD40 repeat protein